MADSRPYEQRFFRKFSQWYYIDAKKDIPSPDVPELVTLLRAVGFNLASIGLGKNATANSGPKLTGMKVTVQCLASGVVAEMELPASPGNAECRCSIFKGNPQPEVAVQDQASFWEVTSSQERLNHTIGSSLLPNVDPNHSRVIKEVFQLLQDDLSASHEANKHAMQRRLSLPPVPKFSDDANSSTSSSVQHSVDSIDKLDGGSVSNILTRRASFGCNDDLKNMQPLPMLTPKPKNLLDDSNSSLTDFETPKAMPLPSTGHRDNNNAIRKLLTAALKLLDSSKGKTEARRATFNLPPAESAQDSAKKNVTKYVATPRMTKSTVQNTRVPTPKPSATRLVRTSSLRGTASTTPSASSMIPGPSTAAVKARTAETIRRRTFIVNDQSKAPRVSKGSVLSPSIETAENNVQVVTPLRQGSKSKVSERKSLPPRPTFNKENQPTK
ncbi:uncharacterized protein LOC132195097 isoform X2 [Neocloeon triangulifer]|uniref:uncharacterized protein LOC132195097 isoform X2 n=1 Tax=Neocloeon triangulifer TaxID=2078957 RepID=UPI00286EBD76|nr:uncharacterized protein LOC132195097 isoform X2 [Neocloeon triangulifer]